MKKVIVIALVLCTLLALAACNTNQQPAASSSAPAVSSSAPAASSSAPAASSSAPAAKKVIGFLQKNTTDTYCRALNDAAVAELKKFKDSGVIDDYVTLDGNTDPITQVNQTDDLINMGVSVILCAPAEAEGSAPILTKAKEKGIPIVIVNSKTNNTDELATAFVASDDVEGGRMMAKFIQEKLPNGGGYGHLQGAIGNSAQIQRGQGLHELLDKDTKWKMLAEQSAEWQGEKAVKFTEDWLALYGDKLNAILSDNDDMSTAVKGAVNAAGRSDIVCIGIDGTKTALQMVKSGKLDGSILQDAVAQGTQSVDACADIIQGKTVQKSIMVPFVLITKDNVDQYYKE